MTTTSQAGQPGKLGRWLYERLGLQGIAYSVPKHANSLPYILGGITFTGFVILIVTGVYLAQFYHPHPSEAHNSVVFIVTGVLFGDLVRSVHFWIAQIVTITALLHMGRILVTGAFKRPREVNWLAGLGLLAVTLGFVFTGSVLKFDQEGLEALQHNTEAANFLGVLGAWFSAEFSRSVPLLTRLFNTHVTILPLAFGLLITAHVFLIKQHGISPKVTSDAKTRATSGEGASNFSLHLRRMAGFGFLVLAVAITLSLIFPAPLGQPGVAGAEVTKPWWMFVWLFPAEGLWGVRGLVAVPAMLGLLLASVPILDRSPYLSPQRRRWILIGSAIVLGVIVISGIYAELQPVTNHLGLGGMQ